MKKIMTLDGNKACARIAYMFTEVAGIYPITPASPMAEHIEEWSIKGQLNIFNDKVKVVEMQSEAGAAGMIHGSLQSGTLATTFTASQGLLLMIPNMYKIAGEMLPCVMHVAARSLATHALSIFGDHQDIYAVRQTGFAMLASSSVQDASYLSAVAHLSAIKSSLPFMHFFDGFRTSHQIDKIEVLDKEDLEQLIDMDAVNKFRNRALNPMNPKIKGTTQNDDIYFQLLESRNKNYNKLPNIVEEYMKEINVIAGTDYKPFNYYGNPNATKVIVAMGSVCETIKETIDELDTDIGLIEVHLYRPFSIKHLLRILPETVNKIAVIDRTKEPGSIGEPLYLDISNALKDLDIEIVGGRYGLSSKNVAPKSIKAVYDMLDSELKDNFTIGIEDDITNLSLKEEKFKINKHDEILIYGYGSDGMVSAGKSMIKLVGDNTNKYVQGYFEYDSKKSGGVTIGHLRFSDDIIRSTYYVENPKLIVVTKDTYFNMFEMIDKLKENGTLMINTSKTKEEFLKEININDKKLLKDKNINIYVINAFNVADKYSLGRKISMIMEIAIIYLTKIMDYDLAKEELKKYINKKFLKKGKEIIDANCYAIEDVINHINKIEIDEIDESDNKLQSNDIYQIMNERKGNSLKVSQLLDYKDGTFDIGTSQYEKRCVSDTVPKWINSNCIQCNQCSFVCPHSVIRPFLLDNEEYNKSPEYIKNRCIKSTMPGLTEYYFIIGISISDCTGCGLCMKICTGKKGQKALVPADLSEELKNNEQDIFNYLTKEITYKKEVNTDMINGSQFKQPKFEFCGACAGCGESTYIKILTQLFGDYMIISNATGCSSIYGGSMPSMPYKLPWANSLFEDNAEYGYGILMGNNVIKNRIKNIMENNMDNPNSELFKKWIENTDSYDVTKVIYDKLDYSNLPKELVELKDYIIKRSIWTIGGDGWAYDIGFSGIDHILASNDDVNILVLDSQVYSNTGGQSSKASPRGAIASFATSGKKTNKKDLARIALSYPQAYVAQISLGANMMQVIKTLKEAEAYKGPSIVIAYTPCISHGIDGGMVNSVEIEKQATNCGYFPIFRYNPETKVFNLDSKNPNFEEYNNFLYEQSRFKMLEVVNKEDSKKLIEENKEDAINRFNYYKWLSEKDK